MNWALRGDQDYAGWNKWEKAQAWVEAEIGGNESTAWVQLGFQPWGGELVTLYSPVRITWGGVWRVMLRSLGYIICRMGI